MNKLIKEGLKEEYNKAYNNFNNLKDKCVEMYSKTCKDTVEDFFEKNVAGLVAKTVAAKNKINDNLEELFNDLNKLDTQRKIEEVDKCNLDYKSRIKTCMINNRYVKFNRNKYNTEYFGYNDAHNTKIEFRFEDIMFINGVITVTTSVKCDDGKISTFEQSLDRINNERHLKTLYEMLKSELVR